MGVITDTIRMQYLNNVRMDLEFKFQLITQNRMELTKACDDLMKVGTDYDSDNPIMKTLNQRQQKLKLLEQKLEQQQMQYQTRLKMVETELGSVKQRIDKNISQAFSY